MWRSVTAILSAAAISSIVTIGHAQFMYLDVNNDAIATDEDRLGKTGPTTVDIWLRTNMHGDGRAVQVADQAGGTLTINSYEVILRAVDGTVEWGRYTNHLEGADAQIGPLSNAREYYVFRGGLISSPPGTYKLGTLEVTVKSGNPRLEFAAATSLWQGASTSFGSRYHGKDDDHTLKFAEDPETLGSEIQDVPRDWAEAAGVGAPSASPQLAHGAMSIPAPAFSVAVSPNPANPQATIIVTTTRLGFLRVRVFDLAGRLVRSLVDEKAVAAGRHEARVPSVGDARPLPSGVYFYRVETAEASANGKLIILK